MPDVPVSQLDCADCGRQIVGDPIIISPTEHLCEDCWAFFLKPLPQHQREQSSVRSKKAAKSLA